MGEKVKLRIYVGHAYSADPEGNKARIRKICRRLVAQGYHPVAPQLWLDQIFDEATQREKIMAYCLSELETCDKYWYYTRLVGGVYDEYYHARTRDIPVRSKIDKVD